MMIDKVIEILKVIFLGIVEGITEWLPVSSTGHMILVDEFLSLNQSEAFKEMFFVVIQLGAILAVPVIFWNKLYPFAKGNSKEERGRILGLWGKVIVGVIPAAILGFLFDDLLDKYLYNFPTVAIALLVYGVAFIVVEKINKGRKYRIESVYDIGYKDALVIGAFQVLSLVPGTSRSGSTILGGMLTGVSRTASAEFSFFMAIPVMLGASFLKLVKLLLDGFVFMPFQVVVLFVGIAVSYVVSYLVIEFLMNFVKRHSFSVFGVYRIILGAVLIGYYVFTLLGKV